jgi:hypothetical protein
MTEIGLLQTFLSAVLYHVGEAHLVLFRGVTGRRVVEEASLDCLGVENGRRGHFGTAGLGKGVGGVQLFEPHFRRVLGFLFGQTAEGHGLFIRFRCFFVGSGGRPPLPESFIDLIDRIHRVWLFF